LYILQSITKHRLGDEPMVVESNIDGREIQITWCGIADQRATSAREIPEKQGPRTQRERERRGGTREFTSAVGGAGAEAASCLERRDAG
jgi:hypothetical protein